MIVVSNTSPITNLAAIGQFSLLRKLFQEVHIPNGVVNELNAYNKQWPGSREVNETKWIKKHIIKNIELVNALRRDIDQGESESIALAVELHADLILLDEKEGRHIGQTMGLKVIGVLGILLESKKKQLISSIEDPLNDLRQRAGFYISDLLYTQIINASKNL